MTRYDRQTILPEIGPTGQDRLDGSHVLVVGAGGLGSSVIPALAGAGVGRLRLLDGDLVSESNLHRQTIFRMSDIGQPKADCAAREARRLNPEIEIQAIRGWLAPDTAGPLLENVDLVVDAADSFAVSYILSDECAQRHLPLIAGSVLGRQGYAGGFCGGGPSLRALFPELPRNAQNCATAGVMGPVVATIGALQAQMAMSALLGLEPSPIGQLVTVDLAGWRFSSFRFADAPEPDGPALRFISRNGLRPSDCVVELRPESEAPLPVTPSALRLDTDAIAEWRPPSGQRVVLCCRSGLRAWRAARQLADRGYPDLALIADGQA